MAAACFCELYNAWFNWPQEKCLIGSIYQSWSEAFNFWGFCGRVLISVDMGFLVRTIFVLLTPCLKHVIHMLYVIHTYICNIYAVLQKRVYFWKPWKSQCYGIIFKLLLRVNFTLFLFQKYLTDKWEMCRSYSIVLLYNHIVPSLSYVFTVSEVVYVICSNSRMKGVTDTKRGDRVSSSFGQPVVLNLTTEWGTTKWMGIIPSLDVCLLVVWGEMAMWNSNFKMKKRTSVEI